MPVELAASEAGTGSPVIILHGLFGSGTNWRSIAQQLQKRHRVLTVDLRNHGASPWADEMSYAAMAGDVRALAERKGLERVSVIGHSMGGKTAMMLALDAPELVDRLVVVDVAPAVYPPSLRAYVRAMRGLPLSQLKRRAEADEALGATIPDPAIRAFLLQNLVPEPNGNVRWRLNLDVIERTMAVIEGWPDLTADRVYPGPVLFVAGGRSGYIRPEHQPVITQHFPNARLVTVERAGHWVHAEEPAAFLATVGPFLDPQAKA